MAARGVNELLCSCRCDISCLNSSGQSALDIAKFWGNSEIVDLLTKSADMQTHSAEEVDGKKTNVPNVGMTHFFNQKFLNRSAHLRKDEVWLDAELRRDTTVIVLFTDCNPYVVPQPDHSVGKNRLGYRLLEVRYSDISSYLDTRPLTIFLGVEDTEAGVGSGRAWFAVDSGGLKDDDVTKIQPHAEHMSSMFSTLQLDARGAAVVSQARPVFAWHDR